MRHIQLVQLIFIANFGWARKHSFFFFFLDDKQLKENKSFGLKKVLNNKSHFLPCMMIVGSNLGGIQMMLAWCVNSICQYFVNSLKSSPEYTWAGSMGNTIKIMFNGLRNFYIMYIPKVICWIEFSEPYVLHLPGQVLYIHWGWHHKPDMNEASLRSLISHKNW